MNNSTFSSTAITAALAARIAPGIGTGASVPATASVIKAAILAALAGSKPISASLTLNIGSVISCLSMGTTPTWVPFPCGYDALFSALADSLALPLALSPINQSLVWGNGGLSPSSTISTGLGLDTSSTSPAPWIAFSAEAPNYAATIYQRQLSLVNPGFNSWPTTTELQFRRSEVFDIGPITGAITAGSHYLIIPLYTTSSSLTQAANSGPIITGPGVPSKCLIVDVFQAASLAGVVNSPTIVTTAASFDYTYVAQITGSAALAPLPF